MKKEEIYVEINNEQEMLMPKPSNTIKSIEDYIDTNTAVRCDNSYQFMKICSLLGIEVIHEFNEKYNCVILEKGHLARCGQFHQGYKILHYSDFINEEILMPKQSNVDLLSCIKQIQQHLKNDYPQGTEIKISKDKIEIYQS